MEGNSDEDSFVEFYCEEVEENLSTCPACQTDTVFMFVSTAACHHVTTSVFNVRTEFVTQPLDTPVGEVEIHTVINCKEAENIHITRKTDNLTQSNQDPRMENLQAPEEMQHDKTSKLVETPAQTQINC
ncbi:uncharacterized protein LOC108229011 [Kryptolebias marmoratus]|uniref:uncharacterized protein LOC108229011 n=1 Tax=Kryptolebias marmoratus TaxID=37003 RepID=UPI0018AD08CC|nr:uncharacterized protein LOC108229011 [Kryptolebias marmoratus]